MYRKKPAGKIVMSRINPKTKLFYVFVAEFWFDQVRVNPTKPDSFFPNQSMPQQIFPVASLVAEKNLYNLGDEYNRPHFYSIALISIIFYPK